MSSHIPLTALAVLPSASAKTCGWRRIIFEVTASTTPPKSNTPCFLGHAGMEHDLQQQVAELVAQVLEIAARDRVGDLISLLDGVGRDRFEVLLQVPGAAGAGRAQRRHDFKEPGDIAGGLQSGPLGVGERRGKPDAPGHGLPNRAIAAFATKNAGFCTILPLQSSHSGQPGLCG